MTTFCFKFHCAFWSIWKKSNSIIVEKKVTQRVLNNFNISRDVSKWKKLLASYSHNYGVRRKTFRHKTPHTFDFRWSLALDLSVNRSSNISPPSNIIRRPGSSAHLPKASGIGFSLSWLANPTSQQIISTYKQNIDMRTDIRKFTRRYWGPRSPRTKKKYLLSFNKWKSVN